MTSPIHPWERFTGKRRADGIVEGVKHNQRHWAGRVVANLEDAMNDDALRGRLVRVLRSALGGELVHQLVAAVLNDVGLALVRHHLLVRQHGDTPAKVYPVSAMNSDDVSAFADRIYDEISGDIIDLIDAAKSRRGRKTKAK